MNYRKAAVYAFGDGKYSRPALSMPNDGFGSNVCYSRTGESRSGAYIYALSRTGYWSLASMKELSRV